MVMAMHWPRRFDDALMAPPDAGSPVVDAALLASLRAWCEGDAFPALMEPLRVASLAPDTGLDAVACALDGSHELSRLGRWRGLAWRMQILWRESVAGRAARPDDPRDCGWWPGHAVDGARPGSGGRCDAAVSIANEQPGLCKAGEGVGGV